MRILLFLHISFEQFNIEQFLMRPRRIIQNSTFHIQHSKSRPFRSSNLVPRLRRGGRCAAAILADRSSRKTKKYFDYDYKIPPMESNHRKDHAGHGIR